MASDRRGAHREVPQGVTAVLLVEPLGAPREGRSAALVNACRRALRSTDAVLHQRARGVIAVLLRDLPTGADSVADIADRVRRACVDAVDGPVRTGVAVAWELDEPLDRLVGRAQVALEERQTAC